jgi:hypothetical protein
MGNSQKLRGLRFLLFLFISVFSARIPAAQELLFSSLLRKDFARLKPIALPRKISNETYSLHEAMFQ